MGIVDVTCLFICADLAGIWQISGQVFCHSPIFAYIAGNISMGLWAATCFCCVFLAFNRTWDLCWPTKTYIFEGPLNIKEKIGIDFVHGKRAQAEH
ncbi:hypothetical protein ANCDUO_20872 [Ancylostoma duodenale]|uniref:Uncharacterized protein n=1 Tax=Ancylostoma duodenale TaxID=51022 RepID=A0A0C2FQV0_9BILA|nr:hypothetical protein ANCDUO_20872 [Ancylostoma duodenale]